MFLKYNLQFQWLMIVFTSSLNFAFAKLSRDLLTISKGYDITAMPKTHEMLGRLLTQTKHDILVASPLRHPSILLLQNCQGISRQLVMVITSLP